MFLEGVNDDEERVNERNCLSYSWTVVVNVKLSECIMNPEKWKYLFKGLSFTYFEMLRIDGSDQAERTREKGFRLMQDLTNQKKLNDRDKCLNKFNLNDGI